MSKCKEGLCISVERNVVKWYRFSTPETRKSLFAIFKSYNSEATVRKLFNTESIDGSTYHKASSLEEVFALNPKAEYVFVYRGQGKWEDLSRPI